MQLITDITFIVAMLDLAVVTVVMTLDLCKDF